jgi:hypothetical protein
MSKSPKSVGAGPKVPGRAKMGSGSKGRQGGNVKGAGLAPPTVNMLDPSQSGNADVVQQRAAATQTGKMQQRQLKKNKSAGLGKRIGRVSGNPKGKK